jgi:hypothetical protein
VVFYEIGGVSPTNYIKIKKVYVQTNQKKERKKTI